MTKMPLLVSIQVGLPQFFPGEDTAKLMKRSWTTGFFKQPVEGRIWLGTTNLEGDGQADLQHHGGYEKAVLAYAAEHYPAWRTALNQPQLTYGAFGENFTVAEATEASVCIGDVYEIGSALVQVSQPRQPCWKLSRRWQIKDLAMQVQKNGRTGWYFRVQQEGYVETGQSFVLRDRPFPQWTIAKANDIMHHQLNDRQAAAELAACDLLSANWRRTLSERATKGTKIDPSSRIFGKTT